jgi:hypothetical protein
MTTPPGCEEARHEFAHLLALTSRRTAREVTGPEPFLESEPAVLAIS